MTIILNAIVEFMILVVEKWRERAVNCIDLARSMVQRFEFQFQVRID